MAESLKILTQSEFDALCGNAADPELDSESTNPILNP